MRLLESTLNTPLGPVHIAVQATDGALAMLTFEERRDLVRTGVQRYATLTPGDAPQHITQSLHNYFAGTLNACDALPVVLLGTPFQRETWRALRKIPTGTTTTYSALASAIERPKAVRAVGAANGANPIAVVIPCHRVIGKHGTLVGYAGGLERKQWLLQHEGALLT